MKNKVTVNDYCFSMLRNSRENWSIVGEKSQEMLDDWMREQRATPEICCTCQTFWSTGCKKSNR